MLYIGTLSNVVCGVERAKEIMMGVRWSDDEAEASKRVIQYNKDHSADRVIRIYARRGKISFHRTMNRI